MKPFSDKKLTEEKICNNRLSRARRVVENAFGILANRFHCLHTVINAKPERATENVDAACLLYNFLGMHGISDGDAHLNFLSSLDLVEGLMPSVQQYNCAAYLETKVLYQGCVRLPT
ncbi:uncharacterized protein LOC144132347 [Amblyomma americanum]|uniref:DDE Tnp4 domain-containing protein n=1 Tax=Amblyomma americanum TaxID=6943 RepID=A0AAQ4DF98_AMBAM